MLYVFFKYLLMPLFWLLFRPLVIGRENLFIRGKAIFVCNHMSMADPIVLAMVSPRLIHFMAKAELFKNPVGNVLFRLFLAFPVNRKQSDMASLKNAIRVLEKGKVFGIFPEGKRAVTDEMDVLEKGAAFLAIRSGAPVVPMYIRRDTYKKMHLRMAVGKPILVGSLVASTPKNKLIDVVTDEISDAMRVLQSIAEG
ncbi:MAG TPA: lysophospholipid acyltransferase family protein [Feifaniaceae bacterium]|nr:lysophospholipid acyltransferase family protein [Feifaniaceae bacterium]